MLEKKDYPLKLVSMKKSEVPVDPGDLNPSYYDSYQIVLKDDKRKKHTIEIQIPRLLDDGTFFLNGSRKYLIYQIILDPIFFVKAGQGKLETLYAAITIFWKKTKLESYNTILIGGYKLPLMALMGYYLGIEKTFKMFGVRHKIQDEEPPKEAYSYLLKDGKYWVFEFDTDEARELVNSIKKIPMDFTAENIYKKDTFEDSIIKITRNRNCIFKIDEVIANIMEPVATQVLKSKLLPFVLPQIILYICRELVRGRIDERNNLASQRVRSSEVFVHQIQSLVLGAYTDYRFRRASGDKDAEYKLDVTQAVKEIVNSQLVRPLENINPTEELSCMTRITPTGDGGVPDANAIVKSSRNIHPTYYGNIDSMDTPEGSVLPDTVVRKNTECNVKIQNLCIGDRILWKDEHLYNVIGKIIHRKKKFILRTKFGDIGCSKEHRFPVYDIEEEREIVLSLGDIMKNKYRYRLVRIYND